MDNPIIKNAQETTVYLQALTESYSAVEAGQNPPDGLSGADLAAHLTSCRNRALAGDGLKAAFMGTLSDAPTVTVDELKARGIKDAEAQMLIDQRDALRIAAFALTGE